MAAEQALGLEGPGRLLTAAQRLAAPQPCQRSTAIHAVVRGLSRFGYGLPP